LFDKITIRAKISDEQCVHLKDIHHLQVWTNSDSSQVNYRSSQYANSTGIQVLITNNKVTLNCSLHKYWEKRNFGKLRNDTVFTISESKAAFEMLLFENGFTAHKVRVVMFEIGLNLYVSYDPITFIELANYMVPMSGGAKVMFVDANYHQNRQRTTLKHSDIRRYFKIYDKGFERAKKEKKAGRIETISESDEKILRIETVHKRINKRADEFFSDSFLKPLIQRFWLDWKDLCFTRDVRAQKGSRKSEVIRARNIINIGAEQYLQQIKQEYKDKKLTEKQYRTDREFIRDFEQHPERFKVIISPQEKEYNSLLYRVYKHTKE
jgi:hypothetical protein